MPKEVSHPELDDVPLAKVLSALGDPVRLYVMGVLADGREHVRSDFTVSVGQSTFSHHMKTLREAGLMRQRMEGTRCHVSLREEARRRYPAVLESVLAAARAERADAPAS
ncbi:ArsR/SmtB family transcription factor [Streptomyces fuscigenes]|uniref:ArsR/SmtB family transcription factor n=1 Tax=Streptomyces fuscigenes TaxID=1528880 RepID=UPI001F347CBA|nr:helix-turn-helix domain-containing protein [Streptomyces fuscigenes]MCF3964216.1 helix-turn-helix domain-containing protein [Streptomyces fuscigenes]